MNNSESDSESSTSNTVENKAKRLDPQAYQAENFESKTQLKQASEVLKKLGLELVGLSKGERKHLQLDDELSDALDLASKINRKKEGFRRQIQLVGKLLRQRDVAPINMALDKLKNAHTHSVQHFHTLEKHRDELIKSGDSAIQRLLEKHPNLDRQKLRQLVRTANKESSQNKAPAASRELFKYLKTEIPED